ncbi:DUF4347 domain-containing protein [Comamonadaceae bacterium G21597-S1]|nr:DUF4347 domain-containing protein [Comamonadaceae bacterium G21597-S1]
MPLRPVCETMEERILHSADLAPLLVSDMGNGLALQQPVQQASANEPLERGNEIAFVDLSVPDADTLLADLRAQQAAGRALEIVTIAADEDGLELIGRTLAGRSDIGAVHVLAHGSDGVMQLGNTRLDAEALLARADTIAGWSGALTADADLLLYGCDFAQTGVGQQLVRDLALLTGADVAASTDLTGAQASGGNWALEFATGRIEAATAMTAAGQQSWAGTLAVDLTSQSSDGTTTATTSFNFAHNVNGGSDRLLLVSLVLGNSSSSATAVTYNGTALTLVATQNSPTDHVRVELWSLVAPTVAAGTVNVTLSSATTLVAGATSYSGVDQSTPLGAAVKGSGNSATASVVVPASSGDLVVDIVGARQVSSFALGANQTQNFAQTQGTGAAALSGLSTREVGATSVTMSNGLTSANLNWASIAVQLRQATSTLLADTPMGTSGNLSGSGGGTGWAGNWSGGGSSIRLSSGSLSDPTGLLPVSGGKAQFQLSSFLFPSSATATRDLSTSIGANGTTTWISFIVQPDTGGSNYTGIEFGSGSATVGFAGLSQGNKFVVGVAGTSGNAVSGLNAVNGQNTLLVLRIEHLAGNDVLTLYVNPTPGLNAPDSASTASASFDLGTFTRLSVTAGTVFIGSNNSYLDEIRVGRTFADVAPTAAPVIISNGGGATASVAIAENTTHVTTVTAIDYDTSSLTYSIAGGVDAALFQIDSGTGVLRFRNAPDFETPLDAGANNIYDVIVRASDGTHSDTQAIAVMVTDVSNGPLIVSTTADAYDGNVGSIELLIANPGADGLISLREAITAANNTPGTDTIIFGVNGTFTLSSIAGTGDDNNDKGDLDIKGGLVIVGNGSGNTTIGGFGTDRVFDLRSGAGTVAMSGLTIQGGGDEDGGAMRIHASVTVTLTDVVIRNNSGKNGGAILNEGNLTITRGSITGNTAVNNDGGAIHNTGTLALNQVELANNAASNGHKGGAIYNKGTATLTEVWAHDNTAEEGGALWVSGNGNSFTLDRVTLNANAASKDGGAVFGDNGSNLLAVNVTISGNSAGENGGGIRTKSQNWSLANTTIANNHSVLGAGAIHADKVNDVRLRASILASNTSAAGAALNISNLGQRSLGNNLATQATAWLDNPSDIISTAAALGLQALAANGGFAPTHALAFGSAAIDTGYTSSPATDQRGVARVSTPDIGAYEYNLGNAAPTISAIGNQNVDEDATLGLLAFTIGDAETSAGALTVTATSLNTTLLPNAGIVLGGSGANRTVTLTPAPNANSTLNGGPVTVRMSVSDGVNTTTHDFLLTVNPTADDPVAVNDLASTAAGTPVVVSVLGNDYDVDDDSFVIDSASLQNGTQGSVSFNSTTITFTPAVTGVVLINYTVRDSTGRVSNTAVLTVNVGANNAPTAAGGMVALTEDGSRAIVLANLGYGDPDGHAFAALRVDSLPSAGSLWFDGERVTSAGLVVDAADLAANRLVFVPAADGNGAAYATMQFSVQDTQGAFSASSGTLTFNVSAQPDAPVVADDTATTPINQAIDVNVLVNDSHPDGTPVSISNVVLDDPSQGTVTISFALDARGSVLFTPAADISGEVVIRYTVSDGTASTIGTLRVTVGANTVPSSENNTVTVAEDGSYTVQVADISYFDPDAGQSFAAVRIDQLPSFGNLFIGGVAAQVGDSVTAAQLAAGALVYQPPANGNGNAFDQLLFSVVDSAGARSGNYSLTVNVTAVNDAPTISTPATIGVIEDTASAITGIVFADIDGGGAAMVATFSVASGSLAASAGSGVAIGGTANALTLTGSLADLNTFLAAGGLHFTTASSATADVLLGIAINDGGNSGVGGPRTDLANSTLRVSPLNKAPVVVAPASLSIVEDVPGALTGISFSDPDAGSAVVSASFSVDSGSLAAMAGNGVAVTGSGTPVLGLTGSIANLNAFIANGRLAFTTAQDATTNVTLRSTIDDGGNTGVGGARSAFALSTIVVTPVNDAPVLASPWADQAVVATQAALLQIPAASFTDVDAGDTLRYAATLADGAALPAWLQFDPLARSFSANAALVDVGTLTLRVTATDDAGASAQMVFRLSVVAPTAEPAEPAEPVEPDEPKAAAPIAAPANTDDTSTPAPVEAVAEATAEPAPAADLEIAIEPPPPLIASDTVEINIDTRITVVPQRQFTFDVASTLPVSQADTVLAAALLTQFSDIATSASSDMFTNEDLLRKLEELKRQMLQQESAQQTVLASSIALTSGLSIGYVVWLIRGGILVSSMLSALPAWQLIDPLPVLATSRGGRPGPGTAPAEDPEVEKLFDRTRKASPGTVPPAPPPTAAQGTQNHPSP